MTIPTYTCWVAVIWTGNTHIVIDELATQADGLGAIATLKTQLNPLVTGVVFPVNKREHATLGVAP